MGCGRRSENGRTGVATLAHPYSLSACLAEGRTGVFDRVEAVGD